MSQKAVFLFAGQGAQTVGMGKDLAENFPRAAETFDRANKILGFDLTGVMFDGPPDELTRTSRCQPALFVHGLVCLDLLRENAPALEMAGTAGLSLGEFTAHAAAGTFDFETGLRIVAKRGLFMEQATDATEGGMAALMGGSEEAVRKLAEACGVDVANYNGPGQIVVSGHREGIARTLAEARENGIRAATELKVAGAYHSRLMQSAQDRLAEELAGLEIREPSVPVVCNHEARVVAGPDEIRRTLVAQVTGSVRWWESMKVFLEQGQTRFIEFGPGGVLANLMKRIDRGAEVISVTDVPSLQIAMEKLNPSG